MEIIKTDALTKFYGKARGIKNVNLVVEEGDFFGFIGPNGAGKSTTIRTLLGLIQATSGDAEIFGKKIGKGKTDILENIGYMPSEAVFYNGMRVKEVLRLSAKLRRKNCDDEAEMLCERLQLDTTKKVEELSFGNRKKVSIICAMQHKPHLYIFDEPTSGLDPLMQREFFELLEERNRAGATVFLSSHVLSEVQHHCRHAAIIRDGEIIACDSVDALSRANAKRVILHGNIEELQVSGVRDLQVTQDCTSFLFGGDINELLRTISKYSIKDITIAEPDLEEIFMHYYKAGGEQ